MYGYKCNFFPVAIIAESIDNDIFYEKKCKAGKFECVINNSILVWNSSVIHRCPYERVGIDSNFTWQDNSVLIDYNNNIILQPTKKIETCNLTLYYTNEGLYVTSVKDLEILDKSDIKTSSNSNLMDKLILSNIDFNEFNDLKWLKFVDTQVCTVLQSLLILYTRFEEEFLKVFNSKGEKAIIYTNNGIIYAPECVKVSIITFPIQSNKCYKDLEISFNVFNEERTGFISKDGIVKTKSLEVNCATNSDLIPINIHDKRPSWYQRVGTKTIERPFTEFSWIK